MAWEYGDPPIQIDPPRCGCTECLIGMYAPERSYRATEAFEALADGRIDDLSSASGSSYAVWRGWSGELHVEEFSGDPSDYIMAELPQWGTTVLIWRNTFNEPQIRTVEDCPDVENVKFVIDD